MMIQCETCLLWQHGECYGMKRDEDIPEHYFCEICRPDLHPSDGPEPMDESPLEAEARVPEVCQKQPNHTESTPELNHAAKRMVA